MLVLTKKVKKAFGNLCKRKNVGRVEVLEGGTWDQHLAGYVGPIAKSSTCQWPPGSPSAIANKHLLVLRRDSSRGVGGLWPEPEV